MEIKIGDKTYKVKQTIRALFLFEEITGKPFEIKTTMDNYLYFYCLLLANNPDFMDWDNFIDLLDDDASIITQLTEILNKQHSIDKLLDKEDTENGKKKD